eukprot:scaffold14478_cov15-Tisochrysis_lutea.AAC.1
MGGPVSRSRGRVVGVFWASGVQQMSAGKAKCSGTLLGQTASTRDAPDDTATSRIRGLRLWQTMLDVFVSVRACENVLDAAVGSICWYVLGYGFAYGTSDHRSNPFIGNHDFGLTHTTQVNWGVGNPSDAPASDDVDAGNYAGWVHAGSSPVSFRYFFQWAFAATAATIVSGAVAERCTFIGYLSYSIFMASWVYPVVVHACWSDIGWLSPW